MMRSGYKPRRRRSGFGISGRNAVTALVAILVAACVAYTRAPTDSGGSTSVVDLGDDAFTGTATRVVDGDTFYISSRESRIRVWGLDAPEAGTPGGSEATATLERLIAGQQLTCRQRDTDRYGRIVGQCFLPDNRDITAAMIASGSATEYCRYSGSHYGTC